MLQRIELSKFEDFELLSNNSIDNFIRYLISRIILESECFHNDLESTDQTISMKLCKQQAKLQSLSTQSPSPPPPPSSSSSSPNSIVIQEGSLLNSSNNSHNNKTVKSKFPLDELIISTHLILLLISILRLFSHDEKEFDNISNKITQIQQLFPRGTWWLPKRILMAYLAIQDEVSHSIHLYLLFIYF